MAMLDKLDLPTDIHRLTQTELYQLAGEVRERIIEVVAQNGGHLSSNLGVVELTVALHAAINSPIDKVVWDVGHQSYAHKLLTGRAHRFNTIRQYGGLSGFTKREESEHDPFGAGHAATSLSAALGIAKARDLKGEKFVVAAVIGDASISSGEAFEAINNIKSVKGPFIIILNDNEMSISKPVGVLSDHITSIRTNPFYRQTKKEVERLLLNLSHVGKPLVKIIDTLLRRTKHLLIHYEKIGVIYEEFGIRYLGPIDAANIAHVMGAIRYAKTADKPVLIHVLSKKGAGYEPAEKDPTAYHGLGKFDSKTGKEFKQNQVISYTEVFGQTLLECAKDHSQIVAISAAMSQGTGLCEFAQAFPERFIDVGISEEHGVTFAGGLAAEGFRPVVAIYSTFMQRSFDQIIHDIALQNLPVVFALDRAGLVGEDGPTHHGVFDLAFMRMIPRLTVMAPKDADEFRAMIRFALISVEGPVSIRYPRGSVPANHMSNSPLIFGKSELLIRKDSTNVAVVAIGSMVAPVYDVITARRFPVKLINVRFLRPFDREGLCRELTGCKAIISVEEGVKQGGLYSALAELICEENIEATLIGMGLENTRFYAQGTREQLLKDAGLDRDTIQGIIEKALGGK